MDNACRVDFYVLEDASQSEEALASRLALMAWEQGFRVLVLARDRSAAETLDRLMWAQPPGRFLPHCLAAGTGATQAPVLIGVAGQPASVECSVVINLCSEPISPAPGLRRLLELVPADQDRRNTARAKFRHYRDLGLQPVSHDIRRS